MKKITQPLNRIILTTLLVLFIITMGYTATSTHLKTINQPLRYDGNIFYVGGSGPDNYTKIQDAINVASDGDTVFVYNGIYEENIIIEKSINLIGEDNINTVIDGGMKPDAVVNVNADFVTIQYFSLINTDGLAEYGIQLFTSNQGTISHTTIIDCPTGIMLWQECDENTLTYNNISSSTTGIYIAGSSYNELSYNVIVESKKAIFIGGVGFPEPISTGNRVSHNSLSQNLVGIRLKECTDTTFYYNNFIQNTIHAFLSSATQGDFWNNNYWGASRTTAKPIFGFFKLSFDWHPAQVPHDIYYRGLFY